MGEPGRAREEGVKIQGNERRERRVRKCEIDTGEKRECGRERD